MLSSLKLPFKFDPEQLKKEASRIRADEWTPHFNTGVYEGEWDGVALRSVGGRADKLYPDPNAKGLFSDTEIIARCSYLREVVEKFQCPIKAVRILRLRPGGKIREHRDYNLGYEDGEVRIHIPIQTSPGVLFFLEGVPVPMDEGEAWYVDVSRPHAVENRSNEDRLHLVIDCEVNDWLNQFLLAESSCPAAGPVDAESISRRDVSRSNLDRLRALVLQESSLQEPLKDVTDEGEFIARVLALGKELQCEFAEGDVRAAMQHELEAWKERWIPPSPGFAGESATSKDTLLSLPTDEILASGGAIKDQEISAAEFAGWFPIRTFQHEDQLMVDWCRLGSLRFTDSFFSESVERALRLPFNRLFRRQTSAEWLCELREMDPGLAPSGFIFHMSRCGSTLMSRMLAASPRNIVIAEASPIDGVLTADVTDEQRLRWLRGMIGALGRPRGGEEHFFIKFDCWHIADLPLILSAYPDLPWVFLYRDPIEVMVSHQDMPGAQVIPRAPAGADLSGWTASPDEYRAKVLAQICSAALEHMDCGNGRLVNYRDLPEAVFPLLREHFGITPTIEEVASMRAVAELDAKSPSICFAPDPRKKRERASPAIYSATEKWLAPIYERLEMARWHPSEATIRLESSAILEGVPS